jgi:protein-S-isoprenylcysteine O-methyltransferase Ste14
MALAIFLAAGTLAYWQAWTFLAVFGGSALAAAWYVLRNDPRLLEHRLRGGPWAEKATAQRFAMALVSVGFVAILVVSGLDHRMSWSSMPAYVAIVGYVLILLGYAGTIVVFRENPYGSATIELATDHRVISTGPYSVVRHPMYAFGLVYLIGIPPALGSAWGLVVVALVAPALIWRLLDEEAFLVRSLAGYSEYRERVRYRLIPFVW